MSCINVFQINLKNSKINKNILQWVDSQSARIIVDEKNNKSLFVLDIARK